MAGTEKDLLLIEPLRRFVSSYLPVFFFEVSVPLLDDCTCNHVRVRIQLKVSLGSMEMCSPCKCQLVEIKEEASQVRAQLAREWLGTVCRWTLSSAARRE